MPVHILCAVHASKINRVSCISDMIMAGLMSDTDPSYIAGKMAEYNEDRKMSHVRGAPCHPQTQGKIERWHQTLKNRSLLEKYILPTEL